MHLKLTLLAETKNSTVSKLSIDGVDKMYVLEDGFNYPKIKTETRIPSGKYKIEAAYQGKFYTKYKAKFNHRFSLHIPNVQGFDAIMVHIGNTIIDTDGCLLTGSSVIFPKDNYESLKVTGSTDAYKQLYILIAGEIERNGHVNLEISRQGSKFEK